MPPSGRTTKAAAKVAKVNSNCALGLESGKKTRPMVVAR